MTVVQKKNVHWIANAASVKKCMQVRVKMVQKWTRETSSLGTIPENICTYLKNKAVTQRMKGNFNNILSAGLMTQRPFRKKH